MWKSRLTPPCSPAYIFDADAFAERCRQVKEALGDIPLTYSIKANPFLLNCIPEEISHVEVCSPGELKICMEMHVAPETIIYSGVMKEQSDIEQAVFYDVGILTAESLLHVQLENEAVLKFGKAKKKVILRLTSGNQFGMSACDIKKILAEREQYPGLEFYGIHHYSGTQKKIRQIRKDMQRLEALLTELKADYGFEPQLIEYGPGIGVDYFEAPYEAHDIEMFREALPALLDFAVRYPLGIEMGRFLAAPCGSYLTQVKDRKENSETNYIICDGGIHHLKYHGQTMAMQVPPIHVLSDAGDVMDASSWKEDGSGENAVPYMICGSLCTVADVLVREAVLPRVDQGNYLLFGRCGAYSVTEGTALFLSRTMPQIYLYKKEKGYLLVRDFVESSQLNMTGGSV